MLYQLRFVLPQIYVCSLYLYLILEMLSSSFIFHQVDKFETEKTALTTDVADLTTRLIEARVNLSELEEENVSHCYKFISYFLTFDSYVAAGMTRF